jgi:DNA-binding NarL/FixJ family response regulator
MVAAVTHYSIAIVDDHPLIVEGLSAVIHRSLGSPAVAVGSEAKDICSITERHSPDAMIVDLGMPGDVLGEISNAAKATPRMKIIVFTASTDTNLAMKALDAGASGYVLKGSSADELILAILATFRGQVYVSPTFASKVINTFKFETEKERTTKEIKLSTREYQIIKLLMAGKQNREIALTLSLSEKTIKGYMTHLMYKLNVKSRLEVVIAAQKIDPSAFEWKERVERTY